MLGGHRVGVTVGGGALAGRHCQDGGCTLGGQQRPPMRVGIGVSGASATACGRKGIGAGHWWQGGGVAGRWCVGGSGSNVGIGALLGCQRLRVSETSAGLVGRCYWGGSGVSVVAGRDDEGSGCATALLGQQGRCPGMQAVAGVGHGIAEEECIGVRNKQGSGNHHVVWGGRVARRGGGGGMVSANPAGNDDPRTSRSAAAAFFARIKDGCCCVVARRRLWQQQR